MHDPVRPPVARRLIAALGSVSLLLVGCGASTSSPSPSASLNTLISFSPIPTETAPPSASSAPTASLAVSWPPGWDVDFCTMFGNAVDAQQLIVDVERALSDGATKDAKGLARDLGDSAAKTTQQLAALTAWGPATNALSQVGGLMDYDTQAADKYAKYFSAGNKQALKQARLLRRKNGAAVPQTNRTLADLAGTGLVCADYALRLESP